MTSMKAQAHVAGSDDSERRNDGHTPTLKAKPTNAATFSEVRESIMARTQKVRAYLAAN